MYDEKILQEVLNEFSENIYDFVYNDVYIDFEKLYNIILKDDYYEIRFFVSDNEDDIYNQSFVQIWTENIFENIDSYGVLFGDYDSVYSEVKSLNDVTDEIRELFSYFTDACISVLGKYEYNEMFDDEE